MKYDGLVPDKLWCQCCLLSIVLAPLSVPTVTCRIHTHPLIPKTPITSQMNCQKTAFLMWLSSKYMIVHQLQSKFFHLLSSVMSIVRPGVLVRPTSPVSYRGSKLAVPVPVPCG